MANNELSKKAVQVYKNHGVVGLLKKSRSSSKYQLRRLRRKLLKPPKQSLEIRQLQDEYFFTSSSLFAITEEDLAANKKICTGPEPERIKTATWFIPYYDHFGYNGIQTIFRFVEKLSKEGIKNQIVIYDYPALDKQKLEQDMLESFPEINNYQIIVFTDDKEASMRKVPESDIAFATFWVSAYILLKYNKTKRKYYFIQDYEPLFYVAGSTYALAESTYRFGFKGIVNTPGLLASINQAHGQEGISFIPAVNHSLYYPDPNKRNKKVRIFFYARPFNPRNAFNLGVLTIRQLIDKYGDKIEVITAGAEWKESDYDLKGKITNLGLIKSLDEVAALYRSCDIGFAFMLNKHTTYQMMEYSASGMVTVMNNNEDHHWLHKDGENCLLAEPSPSAMAEKIELLIEDKVLRAKLVENAQKELGYTWDQQTEMIWNEINSSV